MATLNDLFDSIFGPRKGGNPGPSSGAGGRPNPTGQGTTFPSREDSFGVADVHRAQMKARGIPETKLPPNSEF